MTASMKGTLQATAVYRTSEGEVASVRRTSYINDVMVRLLLIELGQATGRSIYP